MVTENALQTELRKSPLFAPMPDSALAELAESCLQRRLRLGQELFRQGDAAERFYLLVSGQIKLSRILEEGQEKLVEIIQPGETFAEALMFGGKPFYPVSASALRPSALISIDSATYRRLLLDNPEICLKLLGNFSLRLRQRLQEMDSLSFSRAGRRVAVYLLQRMDPDTRHLHLDAPKRLVASRLGIQPETFSRILARLVKENIISMDRRNITIEDPRALEQFHE